jgi:transcriptional regulator with XRE-family HTH domain
MKRKTITLREARLGKGWTLLQLSQKSGVGWATIQAIEAGRTPGNLLTRHHLADALGVPVRTIWPDAMDEWGELFEAMKKDQRREVVAGVRQIEDDYIDGKPIGIVQTFKAGFKQGARHKKELHGARQAAKQNTRREKHGKGATA